MIIAAGIHVVFAKVEAGQLAEGIGFLVEVPGQAAGGGNDAVKLSAVAGRKDEVFGVRYLGADPFQGLLRFSR